MINDGKSKKRPYCSSAITVPRGFSTVPCTYLPVRQPNKFRNQNHYEFKTVWRARFGNWKSVLRIRDVYPGSWFLPIPDPGSRISDPETKNSNKREGWKKISCHNFLCSHKFHKIAKYFNFEVVKKKFWANFQRIIELFTQKIVTKLSKIWIWDPGSETRDPEKTYSGSRIQGSKRAPDPWSRSATLLKSSF